MSNLLGEVVLFVMGLVYFGILIVSMLAPFFVAYAIISLVA